MFFISGDFYLSVLSDLLKKKIISKNSKILITAGGTADKSRFLELGFKNVTISNLDVRMNAKSFKPFKWSFENVEQLSFKDNSFDFTIIHHGLHHSPSPHKGLMELYRVTKNGILVFEGIDNFLSRAGVRLGFSEKYELTAVYNNDLKFGGFNNTGIPNFVYRWTKREIIKTISSFEPKSKPELKFFYGLELPFTRLKKMKNKFFYLFSILTFPFIFLLFLFLHKSVGNRFAFFIDKSRMEKNNYQWIKTIKNKNIPDQKYFNSKFSKK